MKKGHLVSLLFASVLLIGSVLAGCASGGADEVTSGDGEGAQSDKPAEPIDIEIIMSASGLPSPDEDIIKQELDQALNIKINLTGYASEYENQLNVRMAAGNYPDMLSTINRQTLLELAEKGLLLDLTPYEDQLKEVVDFVGEYNYSLGTIDGQQYAVPRIPDVPFNTWYVRKDWLDALNLEVPTTVEELVEVARAFTENDPDGNGKNDTYGMTGQGLATFMQIFTAFGSGTLGNFYIKDGEVMNSYYDPDMQEALAFIKDIIEAGVVDPDLIANTSGQHWDKIYQGQAGLFYGPWTHIDKKEYVEQVKAVNPDAEWLQIDAMEGPAGKLDGVYDIAGVSNLWALPKTLENEPEKLEKVIDLLNYVSSEEGNRLVMYGIEGEHYDVEDGKVVITNPEGVEHSHVYQFTGRPNDEYLAAKFGYIQEQIDFAIDQPRLEVYDSLVTLPEGFNPADANRYAEEEMIKFIYGKRPLSEYEDFLDTLENTYNYDLYVETAKEQVAEFAKE